MWASILSEWTSLIFRWLHVIAAVGWIGSSFYFIHLDLELKPREGLLNLRHGKRKGFRELRRGHWSESFQTAAQYLDQSILE